MKHELETKLAEQVKELFGVDVTVELTRPEEQFGDFASNVALQLAKAVGKNPREIAETIAARVRETEQDTVETITVDGPGFINLKLKDQTILTCMLEKPMASLAGQTIVAEYSDPNPFKVLHAGHLYTSVVGDAMANLLENAGATVHRVNFGGDVGLHVGKTMWAILRKLGGEDPSKLVDVPPSDRAEWMAAAYVEGTKMYEEDEQARAEIIALNKRVYQVHAENDHDSPFAQIYWTCRQWSYDYFDAFYERIGTQFEKYYPESSVADLGLKTVQEQLAKGVFERSDGAIIFDGEKRGLHKRVFVTREGIPTYEAKDVGLIMQKYADYAFDVSVVITGNEQEQYMAVVLKAVEQFAPELVQATRHLTHGIVKLKGGIKMSSRKGNFLRAVDVLEVANKANQALTGQDNAETSLGAVKYAFLKNRIGGDIVYDPEESVSLEGNSGPYIQYAHARARSILKKADREVKAGAPQIESLQPMERSLVRKLSEYPEVIEKATTELMPHHICTYLYELAQTFNRFYEQNRVVGDEREAIRLWLVSVYANTLRGGLSLMGIASPDKM